MTEQQRDLLIKLFRTYGDLEYHLGLGDRNNVIDEMVSVQQEFYDLVYSDIPRVTYETIEK